LVLGTEFTSTYHDPLPVRKKAEEPPMHHPEIVVYPISYRQDPPLSHGFAGGNMINLRSKPSTKSTIVGKLPLGTPIEIVAQSNRAVRGIREDHWYRVRAEVKGKTVNGFLFGPTINPHRIEADFDLDGNFDMLYGSYNERKEMLIHYHNPDGAEPLAWTIIGQFSNAGGMSDNAVLSVISKETAGIPLLKIEVDCSSDCKGSVWTKYLSFTESGIRRALEIEENAMGNEQQFVDFHPKSKRITLTKKLGSAKSKLHLKFNHGTYKAIVNNVIAEKTAPTIQAVPPQTTAINKPIETPRQILGNKSINGLSIQSDKSLRKGEATSDKTVNRKEEKNDKTVKALAIKKTEVISKKTPQPEQTETEKPVARITPTRAK